jgi:protoheme IX farnesyltransferase
MSAASIQAPAQQWKRYLALTKPRILPMVIVTALPIFGLAAAGAPPLPTSLGVLLGIVLVAAAANTLNMYVERDVDGLMARTRRRPLPAGRMAPGVALAFGLLQAAVAVPLLALGAGLLTGLLGAIALVLYVLVYTPLKRKTTWSLLIGAIPGAMPPLLGWTAATGDLSLGGLALFAVIFVWQVPHFLAIALYQESDYRAAGLKVLPVVAGEAVTKRAIVVTLILQALVTLALVPLGVAGTGYLVGALLLGGAMLAWGLLGLRAGAGRRWARALFLISILYLPALFGLMFV